MRAAPFVCLLLIGAAFAEDKPLDLPPSPSSVSGERIWPDPAFTHWPAIAFVDEQRNVSFQLPVRKSGTPGAIGWQGQKPMPFTLPPETDSISGLLPTPTGFGVHTAQVSIADQEWDLSLRLVDAREPWPLAALRNGFPVDADGVPVILLDNRRDPASERKWSILAESLARPTGKPLLVGDPLEAMGDSTWNGLEAERRPAMDERYPHYATLVQLATLPEPLPRAIVWSPGNQELFGGAWSAEEERVFGVLRSRFEALKQMPLMVLLLPPVPLNGSLKELAAERRALLVHSANSLGWTILDAERLAGPAEEANKIGDQTFTRYPTGPAQEKIRAALREVLNR